MMTLTFEQIDRIAAEYFDDLAAPAGDYKITRTPGPLTTLYKIIHLSMKVGDSFYEDWQYRISQLENGEVVYGPATALDLDKYSHAVVTCAELEQRIHQGEERAAATLLTPVPKTKKELLEQVKDLKLKGKTHADIALETSMSVSNVKLYLNELGLVKKRQG